MLSFFASIKLTLSQWLLALLTALVGLLLIALRIQGGKLHRAQVMLLAARLNANTDKADQLVMSAKNAYVQALQEYNKAGGEL
jgi:hypothetical protein